MNGIILLENQIIKSFLIIEDIEERIFRLQ